LRRKNRRTTRRPLSADGGLLAFAGKHKIRSAKPEIIQKSQSGNVEWAFAWIPRISPPRAVLKTIGRRKPCPFAVFTLAEAERVPPSVRLLKRSSVRPMMNNNAYDLTKLLRASEADRPGPPPARPRGTTIPFRQPDPGGSRLTPERTPGLEACPTGARIGCRSSALRAPPAPQRRHCRARGPPACDGGKEGADGNRPASRTGRLADLERPGAQIRAGRKRPADDRGSGGIRRIRLTSSASNRPACRGHLRTTPSAALLNPSPYGGRTTPFSVMIAVTSSAGVTSKAGL
jgi:hypothetical protein